MSKIRKGNNNLEMGRQINEESFAYKSVIFSAVLAGIFLFISILFNGEIFTFFTSDNSIFYVVGIILRVAIILLFFIFMMISIGNYKELSGKPIDFKVVILIFIFSLAQGFRDPVVFFFSFVGLICLLVYIYLIQER
ncbi:MAG: hypothetical protein ACFE9R_11390 [Candidatus Hermodarchaeota archaeon]